MRDVVEPDIDDLWSSASSEALERIASLARRTCRAQVVVLRSFSAGRTHTRFRVAPGDESSATAEVDAEHDPCRLVFASGQPVVLASCDTVQGGGYLGVPVRLASGRLIGSLCAIDPMPRPWSPDEVDLLRDLAAALAEHIQLGHRLATRERADQARLADIVDANHELRTPLQAIVGFTEFLKTETRRDLIAAHARNIQAAASSILGVISLTLERAGADHDSQLSPVDLTSFAGTCLSMVGPMALEKGLKSELTIEPGLPQVVMLDRQKVFQALLNLLNNAVKFTDRGTFTLDIRREADSLRFSVIDTGIGIAADKRDMLFQRFSRIDPEGRVTDGSGLGLSITKTLVESMQGRIGVGPSGDHGTTFWFDLPDAALPATQPPVAADPSPVGSAAGRPSRILVADDLDLNRKLITDMLSIDGHLVDAAADGETAVNMARETTYDLVLMDMIMPGMDGLAAARAIRSLPAPACDVPIVALTANCGRAELDSCLAAGMNATLTKPMTFDGLTSAVSTWTQARTKAA